MPGQLSQTSLRFATDGEQANWDSLLVENPGGEIWQSKTYAAVKQHQDYVPRYVLGVDFAPTLILERKVPLLGKFWYAPAGPVAPSVATTIQCSLSLAAFARKNGAFMLKVEPRLTKTNNSLAAMAAAGFRSVARVLPNESTILLDISGEDSEVMGRFSGSTRTKIRKADKIGFETVRVPATEANCRVMYDLLGETGDGKFQLRPFAYYLDFWQSFERAGQGQMVLGYVDGVAVAGMYGIVLGGVSSYKDGASTKSGNLPNGAMYRMQWELILWGKEHGATVHDLVGAPPSDRIDDSSHPLYGVGQYKVRLSKDVTDYVGAFDIALKPVRTNIWWKLAEPLARRWALRVRKDIYY